VEYFFEKLLIIIVTYNENYSNSKTFKTIINSFESIKDFHLDFFIYDNSPNILPNIENQILGHNPSININYYHDNTNSGLGKAYNKGAEFAIKTKKKWLLLLDQDTELPEDILVKYFEATSISKKIDLFAPTLFSHKGDLISPSKYKFKRGFKLSYIPKGITPLKGITPINSGILISLDLYKEVGGYNEKIRLDFSDHAFIEKVRAIRKYFFVIPTNVIHNLSSNKLQSIEQELIRFAFFCEGAKFAGKDSKSELNYFILVFLRSLKLSFVFKNIQFFKILYSKWFLKKQILN
jgi:GT2 family glycosyltransferase